MVNKWIIAAIVIIFVIAAALWLSGNIQTNQLPSPTHTTATNSSNYNGKTPSGAIGKGPLPQNATTTT